MASNAMNEIAEEFLLCQICLEDFKQPKVLPCLHTFCQPCLERLLARVGKLSCPTCRQDVPLPQNGVQGLKSNFLVGKLHHILQQQPTMGGLTLQPRNDGVPCTACEVGNLAQYYCVECTDYLCQVCTDAHSRLRATRSHNVVTVAQLQSGRLPSKLQARKTSKCEAHNELHKFYCDTCRRVICLHCVVTAHKDHQYVEIEVAAERERAELWRVQNAADLHEKWIETLRTVKSEWSLQVQRAEEQMEQQERTIIEAVRKVKKNRIEKLHAMHAAREKQMDAAMYAAENDLVTAKSCVQFMNNVLEYGSPAEFMSMAGRMGQSADKKIAEKAELTKGFMNLTFDSQANNVEDEMFKLMGIKQSTVPIPNALLLGRAKVASGSYKLLKVIDIEEMSGHSLGESPHSLAVTAEGDIVVGSYNWQECGWLQFLGKDGSFKTRVDMQGWGPRGVAVLATGELLVTGDGHKIHVLDNQGRELRVIRVTGVAENLQERYAPTEGISVDGMGRIVVNIVQQVFLLDPSGATLLKFGDEGHYNIRVTAVNSNYQIIGCGHNVQVFDPTGPSFTLRPHGLGDGQLCNPHSAITDNDDNILVTHQGDGYQNGSVSLFSRDGTFIRNVLTGAQHGLKYPMALALTHDGHLVVSDEDSLKIFVAN